MIEQSEIGYSIQIPKSTISDLIRKTEEIIRIKQICKSELPTLCNTQINDMLTENLQSITQQKQQKPILTHENPLISISQTDNLVPFFVKSQKSNQKIFSGRLSFDASSTRKSSAFKSRREQYTASTSNRKMDQNFSKTHEGSFFQERPWTQWTQSECRKRNSKIADVSAREKFIRLKEQFLNQSFDQEQKRVELDQKRRNQQAQQQKIHSAFLRMSYQKRLLKQEFENAKNVQTKPSSLKKDKQTIEIVNYQFDNGSVLTNKFRKPFRKTIQNIINLKYVDKSQDRIFKRVLKKQCEVQNPKRKKNQLQKQQKLHKNSLMNQAYNNEGNRQVSFIPYVTISPGISLSESAIKATIVRSRPVHDTSRQKFLSTIQNRAFRSYSKDYQRNKNTIESQIMTIDVCEKNRGSRTSLNYQTKDSFRKSILWGAKTSRDGHRIKLQSQDLLKQLTD